MPSHNKSEVLILQIGINQLEVKPVAKYLGVLIDNQLTRKNHIEYVVNKLSAVAGILSKLKHYVPREALKTVYCSTGIGFPHLLYGVLNWGNSASKYIHQLQVQQNKLPVIKILSKTANFRIRLTSPIYKQYSLLKLPNIHATEICKFFYRFINKRLIKCFDDYFVTPSYNHRHATRYATDNNFSILYANKFTTERSIKIQ